MTNFESKRFTILNTIIENLFGLAQAVLFLLGLTNPWFVLNMAANSRLVDDFAGFLLNTDAENVSVKVLVFLYKMLLIKNV